MCVSLFRIRGHLLQDLHGYRLHNDLHHWIVTSKPQTVTLVQFYWRWGPLSQMCSEICGCWKLVFVFSHTSQTPEWHHGGICTDPVAKEVGGAM